MNESNHTTDAVSAPTPVLSVSPVMLTVPGRVVDLQMKVSAPVTGDELPIILLSHGHGPSNFISSLHGYDPLADFYASHGFVVIRPTHLDSKKLGLREADNPEAPLYWRSRAKDMHHILDHLDEIEATVPQLSGRLDRSRVAVVGHSLGGHTAGMLSGMRVTDPGDGTVVDLSDPRIRAGVLLAAPGDGEDLAETVSERYPVLRNNSFAEMTTPALVVVGDKDVNPAFSERADWRADAYHLSPGPKSLLTLFGAEHGLGGISGYDAAETTDENPERVAIVQHLTWAYLHSELYPGDPYWQTTCDALIARPNPLGQVESR